MAVWVRGVFPSAHVLMSPFHADYDRIITYLWHENVSYMSSSSLAMRWRMVRVDRESNLERRVQEPLHVPLDHPTAIYITVYNVIRFNQVTKIRDLKTKNINIQLLS